MLVFKDNSIVFDYSRCQQCGVCESVCPKDAISTNLLDDGTHDIIVDSILCIRCQKCVKCCPANRKTDFIGYFDDIPHKRFYLGYNEDANIRRSSSSGGVCRTIIIESLRNGMVDGVYTMKKLPHYPSAEGEFYTKDNIPKYEELSNSIYHSVMIGKNLSKVQKCERLMIVGTSCQLYAMERALHGKYKELIKLCIFCKQQKTLDSTRFLAKVMGAKLPMDMAKFSPRYRGNGWPGIVSIMGAELPYSRAAQLPFGRRLWTVGGCNICGDSFGKCGNITDITLMDPWCIRKANDLGETLVIVHTRKGLTLITSCQNLNWEEKSYNEVRSAFTENEILRKQKLIPFFKGKEVSKRIKIAGYGERFQRKCLQEFVDKLPQMPMLFYRALCKLPDLRNIIL